MQDTLKRTMWNLFFRSWAWVNVPLLGAIGPKIVDLDLEKCRVRIRLFRRHRNHFQSMYIGVLVAGADAAAGILATYIAYEKNLKASVLFKDLDAQFLKRATGDTDFVCRGGAQLAKALEECAETGKRCNDTVDVLAFCEGNEEDPVARFRLTVSVKLKDSAV